MAGESRFQRLKHAGRRIFPILGIVGILLFGGAAFTGCRGGDGEETEKVEDLEFSVVGGNELPEKLAELIAQKKEKPFKLTYADGADMYVVIGEGPQKGGGFSVAVREFYRTDNAIVIKTELIGPEKGEAAGNDLSYPVLVVKTAYREEPVVFR